jgi:hypothetical protein
MNRKTIAEIIAPNEEDENGPYWDPWIALDIHCASYSGAVDQDALNVLRLIGGPEFIYCTGIAERLGLSASHVELLQSIFCSADWCDYGTSPRGCFPTDRDGFPALIAAFEVYYERQWGEKPASTSASLPSEASGV